MNRRGFTLMELLAAIGIASITLAMLASAVRSQGSNAVYQLGSADMQQNVRGALELFRRELRMAGYGMASVPPGAFAAVAVPAADDGEVYRVDLRGNFGFVRSRVAAAGVAEGSSTVPLVDFDPSGCLPNGQSFTSGERVAIESMLWGVADVYLIAGFNAGACTITVSPALVRDYEAGSPVNEVRELRYRLDGNGVLWRGDAVLADQVDALEMAYILRDGTQVADPASALSQLRSASVRLRAAKPEHQGLTPKTELVNSEIRIRNLAIIRYPMGSG